MTIMNNDRAIIETFKPYLPAIKTWIDNLISKSLLKVKSVAYFDFKKLPLFFSKETLDLANVVIVDKPPMLPLSSFGLTQFRSFEQMEVGAITYKNTYFIRESHAQLESVHFHELVHIVQWKHLGVDNFLLLYGLGLLKYGYNGCLLEQIAFSLENDFRKNKDHFSVEREVIKVLDARIKK